jgi:hypothetical protein
MYADIRQCQRIGARIPTHGESLRSVATTEGISPNTSSKMVRHGLPPGYKRATAPIGEPVVQSRPPLPWRTVQGIVRSLPERDAEKYLSLLLHRQSR